MTIQGRIFTHEGHTPIAGATVEFVDNQEIVKSDSTGYFSISKPRSFLTDPHIRITNKNYKPFEVSIRQSKESKSYEVKSESYFIDYEKPFYPDSNNKNTFTIGTWIKKYSENFAVNSDSLLVYLDILDVNREIEGQKNAMTKADGKN